VAAAQVRSSSSSEPPLGRRDRPRPPEGALPGKCVGVPGEPLWNRREKAARRSAEAQLGQLTIRQRLAHELNERKAAIPGILDALVAKAQRGDVPAARELRGWFDQGLGRPEAASLDTAGVDERSYSDMTPEERARLRAGIIKRIAEAEAELAGDEQAEA
jgi:hypothetical protein